MDVALMRMRRSPGFDGSGIGMLESRWRADGGAGLEGEYGFEEDGAGWRRIACIFEVLGCVMMIVGRISCIQSEVGWK